MAKKTTTRKSRTTKVEETSGELEVEEVGTAEPVARKPPAGIETWLVLITWAALIGAIFLINIKMKATFGEGWPV